MIRIGSEFIFWSVAFFVVMLIFDGFDIALQSTMFIIGMIYYTYNIAFVYLRLKKVCFNFEQAASKKEWLWFLLTNIIIWSLFPNFVNVSPKTHRRTVERFACAFP